MNEKEEDNSNKERPVAGMRALGLGAFCAFGVFVISIIIGMSSVLAGKDLIVAASMEKPLEFKYEGASEKLFEETKAKLIQFADNADGQGKLHFSVGVDELNSLIKYEPTLSDLIGIVEFKKVEKDLIADVSFPLSRLKELDGKGDGRYLNGEAVFYVYVKKREFKIQLSEFRMNGKEVEIDMIAALKQRNLLRHWLPYEANEKKVNLVADAELKENRIHLMNWKEKKKLK